MIFIILITFGLILLIKGADWLISGASSLARKIQVPDLAIGLTIVAFGTSMPEFVVNIFASAAGNPDIAIGNILGSNIFNILVILGVSALVRPLSIKESTIYKESPYSLIAAVVLGIMVSDKLIDGGKVNILSRIDGIVFISFFGIFFYFLYDLIKEQNG